jgi:hypothetical protein
MHPYNHKEPYSPKGYVCVFTDYYTEKSFPPVLNKNLKGWDMRRQLKAYAEQMGYKDYKIIRSLDYQLDLSGPVYEFWLCGKEYQLI